MGITVNTNVPSLTSQRNLLKTSDSQSVSLQRLSSGYRINSAKDDAAGLAISDRMTSQIRGLNQAVRNANDGISLSQTAEGALQETTSILQRMRELSIQSANDTNNASDRASLQDEVNQLQSELNRIAETTQFNNTNLLDGTFGIAKFHVGALANQVINLGTGDARGTTLGAFQSFVEGSADLGYVNNYDGEDITVNGAKGAATIALDKTSTAKEVASQINAAHGDTGVSANARTVINLSNIQANRDYKLEITSNGYSGTVSATVNKTGDLQDLVDSINDQSNRTGVFASLNNRRDQIMLVDHDGDSVELRRTDTNEASWTLNVQHSDENTGTIQLSEYKNDPEDRIVYEEINPEDIEEGEESEAVEREQRVVSGVDGEEIALYYGDRVLNIDGSVVRDPETNKPKFWAVNEEGLRVYKNPFEEDSETYLVKGSLYENADGVEMEFKPTAAMDQYGITVGDTRVEENLATIRGHVLLEGSKNFSANYEGIGGNVLNKYDKTTQSAMIEPVNDINITTQEGANASISVIDMSISKIDEIRSNLGASQNRFQATISNLTNVSENVSASRSRIMDSDFAKETAELAKSQILQQAGLAMLSQANQLPQAALTILG